MDISAVTWPDGNELVSPFVYQDDKLVGFVDTKALITDSQTLIYLPYTHIEADFSSIEKGKLSIHAPKATTKKDSWKDSEKEDIPEAQFKYKGYTTVDQIKNDFSYDYLADIANGTWSEPLWDLEQGGYKNYSDGMFWSCFALTSFSSDSSGSPVNLSSLMYGIMMFNGCKNLTSFSSNLSSLMNGFGMFGGCTNLTSFNGDLSSLTNGQSMFFNCKLDTTSVQNIADTIKNVSSLTNGL